MAYGLEVRTQRGMEDVLDIYSMRHFGRVSTTSSGDNSATIVSPSGWTRSNGGVFIRMTTSSANVPAGPKMSWSGNNIRFIYFNSANLVSHFFVRTRNDSGGTGYGALVKNRNNVTVLDTEYRVLSQRASGTSTGTKPNPNYEGFLHQITANDDDIIFFELGSNGDAGAEISSSNTTRRIVHSKQTMQYRIFSVSTPNSSGGYGLQFRNSAGQITFDSNVPTLRADDLYTDRIENIFTGSPARKSIVSGTNFVACTSFLSAIVQGPAPSPGGGNAVFMKYPVVGVRRVSSTQIQSYDLGPTGLEVLDGWSDTIYDYYGMRNEVMMCLATGIF